MFYMLFNGLDDGTAGAEPNCSVLLTRQSETIVSVARRLPKNGGSNSSLEAECVPFNGFRSVRCPAMLELLLWSPVISPIAETMSAIGLFSVVRRRSVITEWVSLLIRRAWP
ncbi:hypothetical protein ACFX5Q_32805 [Mesorhizobium sp. IMUNJ 23033]|uniref:hypothetical protein n=1 Tax=Mesorhizobium sp. IMUNJ 23033 TaxID=3378039 RepID=UPI00384C853A